MSHASRSARVTCPVPLDRSNTRHGPMSTSNESSSMPGAVRLEMKRRVHVRPRVRPHLNPRDVRRVPLGNAARQAHRQFRVPGPDQHLPVQQHAHIMNFHLDGRNFVDLYHASCAAPFSSALTLILQDDPYAIDNKRDEQNACYSKKDIRSRGILRRVRCVSSQQLRPTHYTPPISEPCTETKVRCQVDPCI